MRAGDRAGGVPVQRIVSVGARWEGQVLADQGGGHAPGQVQQLTPSIEALYVPNIDDSLDDENAKREFWSAFRMLGQWWADLPPY